MHDGTCDAGPFDRMAIPWAIRHKAAPEPDVRVATFGFAARSECCLSFVSCFCIRVEVKYDVGCDPPGRPRPRPRSPPRDADGSDTTCGAVCCAVRWWAGRTGDPRPTPDAPSPGRPNTCGPHPRAVIRGSLPWPGGGAGTTGSSQPDLLLGRGLGAGGRDT